MVQPSHPPSSVLSYTASQEQRRRMTESPYNLVKMLIIGGIVFVTGDWDPFRRRDSLMEK